VTARLGRAILRPNDSVTNEVVNLTCFLVDRDADSPTRDGKWQSVVEATYKHLTQNHNEVSLPIVVQALQKQQ
jgi:hypothetical protein